MLRQFGDDGPKDRLVDSSINSAVQHVTSTDEPYYLSCRGVDVHIATSGVSRYHPRTGLLIDKNQIRNLAKAIPNDPFAFALFAVCPRMRSRVAVQTIPPSQSWSMRRIDDSSSLRQIC